jgi:hypothetical protein
MIERIHEIKEDLKIAFEMIEKDKLIKTKTTNLTEEEYKDIKILIEFLKPFRIATKYFEETTSSTNISISGMIPVIINLIHHCKNFKSKVESENILNMIENIREEINDRWVDIDIMFYATSFVNPIFKKLQFLKEEKINEVKDYIKQEIDKIEFKEDNDSEEDKKEKGESFKCLFGFEIESEGDNQNEFINYNNELPQKFGVDIFEYWKNNSKKYPKLSIVARKLLSLQGSSSDTERDFSFMGNMITEKRTNLKPDKVSKMVFIKKNIKFSKYFKK